MTRSKRRENIVGFIIIAFLIIMGVIMALCPLPKQDGVVIDGDEFEVEIKQKILLNTADGRTVSANFFKYSPSASASLGIRYNQTFEASDPNIGDVTLLTGASFNTNTSFVWEGSRSLKIEDDTNTTLTSGMGRVQSFTKFYANETCDLSFYYYITGDFANNTPYVYFRVLMRSWDNGTGSSSGGLSLLNVDLIGDRGYDSIGDTYPHGEGEYYLNYTDKSHLNKWGVISIPDLRYYANKSVENDTAMDDLFNSTGSNFDIFTVDFFTGNEEGHTVPNGNLTILYVDSYVETSKPADYLEGEHWFLDTTGQIVTAYSFYTLWNIKVSNSSFNLTNSKFNDDFIVTIYNYLNLTALKPSFSALFTDDLDYYEVIDLKGQTVTGGATLNGQDASSISGSLTSALIPLQIDSTLGTQLKYEFSGLYQADGELANGNFTRSETGILDLNSMDFTVSLQELLLDIEV
jgi:hypothetical protein